MKNKLYRKGLCCALSLAMMIGSLYVSDNVGAAKRASLKTKKITMKKGQSKTITIKNKNKKYTYSFKSSKSSVAKVTKKGKVTALKNGTAKITVKEAFKSGKKTKTRKLGVCNVTVKGTNVSVTNTPVITDAPVVYNTPAATNNIPSSAPTNSTAAKPTDTPYFEKQLTASAYDVLSYDFDGDNASTYSFEGTEYVEGKEGKGALIKGSTTMPMGKFMQYGGKLYVSGYFKQDSGSKKELRVSYDSTYLYFEQNGAYINKDTMKDEEKGDSAALSLASGEWTKLEFVFDVNKYTKDFNLTIALQGDGSFVMDDVKVESEPCKNADYARMVENSTRSVGNVTRIKAAMEKAKNGEDITIAYIGGSITEGFAASETNNAECYAETSCNLFREKYTPGDGSNVRFINAGMSGTPSSLALVRYERDVIAQNDGKPADILFIDFAVNDNGGTDAVYYENLIRYALEQGSAVVLMFVMYSKGNGHESTYCKIGDNYDLTMVSPATGMADCDKTSFDDWFYWSDGHPDVGGHRYMADCIMNTFDMIDNTVTTADDPYIDIKDTPMYTKNAEANYVGMKTIEANTEAEGSIISIDRGSFTGIDKSQPTLQYIKNGEKDLPWFPNEISCPANKYTDAYKVTLRCNSMLIAYRANTHGKADVYVDGVKVKTLDNTNSSWGHANIDTIINSSIVGEHTIEIKIPDDAKNNIFTIYAIGYSDQDAFRAPR